MKKIITHPTNRDALMDAIGATVYPDGMYHGLPDTLLGIPIMLNDAIPERDIEEVWHPPKDGRFTTYGPEDEDWMRPLGMGRFEYVDRGPLFFMVTTDPPLRTMPDPFPVSPLAY